jgi:hypothetical protein
MIGPPAVTNKEKKKAVKICEAAILAFYFNLIGDNYEHGN